MMSVSIRNKNFPEKERANRSRNTAIHAERPHYAVLRGAAGTLPRRRATPLATLIPASYSLLPILNREINNVRMFYFSFFFSKSVSAFRRSFITCSNKGTELLQRKIDSTSFRRVDTYYTPTHAHYTTHIIRILFN